MSVFLTNNMHQCTMDETSNKISHCGFGPKKTYLKSRENENHFAHKTTEAKSFSVEMIYDRTAVNPQE